jgi:hypothetical protein
VSELVLLSAVQCPVLPVREALFEPSYQTMEQNRRKKRAKILRFFADCAAKKWPLRGSKSNDLRHKNIIVALKARSQGKQEELQLLRRMFICKTCQIR